MKRKYPFLRKWIDLTEQWNILLREVMESASLDTLKKHLEMVLGNLLEVSLLEQSGWATWSPEVPANLLWNIKVPKKGEKSFSWSYPLLANSKFIRLGKNRESRLKGSSEFPLFQTLGSFKIICKKHNIYSFRVLEVEWIFLSSWLTVAQAAFPWWWTER